MDTRIGAPFLSSATFHGSPKSSVVLVVGPNGPGRGMLGQALGVAHLRGAKAPGLGGTPTSPRWTRLGAVNGGRRDARRGATPMGLAPGVGPYDDV